MSRVRDLWHRKDRTKTARHGKGLRWQAIWTDGRGGRQTGTHRTRDAAWAWIRQQDDNAHKGFTKGSGRVLVSELQQEWFDSQLQWKPKNRHENTQTWENHIIPRFGGMLVEDIDRRALRAWVADMAKTLAPRTVDTYFGRFVSFLGWCVEEKLIPENPSKGVTVPKGQKRPNLYLTVPEFLLLRQHMSAHYQDALDVAVTTGMRPGELWELRADDVDPARRRIHISRSSGEVDGQLVIGDTKTEEARSVPITQQVADMLAGRVNGKRRTDLIFTTVRGDQVRQSNFSKNYWKTAISKTDLPEGLRFYDLRHTAASWAIQSGASVKAVQRMLGHATAVITLEVYAHLFDDELDSVADRIGEMLGGYTEGTAALEANG